MVSAQFLSDLHMDWFCCSDLFFQCCEIFRDWLCFVTERRVNVLTETKLSLGLQVTEAVPGSSDTSVFIVHFRKAKVSDWLFLLGAFGSDADLHDAA